VDLSQGMAVCHISAERYMSVMPTLSGTSSLDWVKGLLYPDVSFQDLETKLDTVPVGSHGILYHPYLYGERAPFRNPFARGGFYGLSAVHGRSDMMRAAYEGLALSIYDCYRSLPPIQNFVKVCGGGASSEFLCQMMADCLGRPVVRPALAQAGIAGIVSAVRSALGISLIDAANESSAAGREPGGSAGEIPADESLTEGDAVFQPREACHERYMLLYEQFKDLQNSMECYWDNRTKSGFCEG
jgi:sugar (pentulose or hexulose) kinase